MWHKSLYFLSWFDCPKIPSAFNEKYIQISFKNGRINSKFKLFMGWFWNWFQLHQFWVNRKPFWHKSLHFSSWFDCPKIPSAFNGRCLRPIIKNGHFIDFKSLVYSILVTFFRLKKPKDTEVFLALKTGELI